MPFMHLKDRPLDFEGLLYEPEYDSKVLWIKFNTPEVLNAMSGDTIARLGEYMRAGDEDPGIRVIVVTGSGRAFSAGANMKAGGRRDPDHVPSQEEGRVHMKEAQLAMREISLIRKPTIAMVNGPAVGMGMDVALFCDIRVGCENTRFFTYQNFGQIIEQGGMYTLPRLAGLGNALEILFTGGYLWGDEAYRIGVLNHYWPSEELEARTRELCKKIVNSPPLVQTIGKQIMRRGLDCNLETVYEMCSNVAPLLSASEDSKEAVRAFLEKREPNFVGR
ncbi:MAG: enoyl-CoA hydratase/isomerase family protein [Dehalococcoidia bacterium]|nr:MAG: enoyl-CoA hydratase/isomerase family protein [Dehalococcoidia bacterium]